MKDKRVALVTGAEWDTGLAFAEAFAKPAIWHYRFSGPGSIHSLQTCRNRINPYCCHWLCSERHPYQCCMSGCNTDHRNRVKRIRWSVSFFAFFSAYCSCSKWANVNCYLFSICSWLSPIILRPLIKHLIRSFILWLFLCFTTQRYALFVIWHVV